MRGWTAGKPPLNLFSSLAPQIPEQQGSATYSHPLRLDLTLSLNLPCARRHRHAIVWIFGNQRMQLQIYSVAIKNSNGAVWAGGYWVCLLLSAVPTLILSGARVGGRGVGGVYVVQLLNKQDPLSLRRLAVDCFPLVPELCHSELQGNVRDSVFSTERREMERGENRHAGRSLHYTTGVTCLRSQPHTNKQFLELNQTHTLCMPEYVVKKWDQNVIHSCKVRKKMRNTGRCSHDTLNMSWILTKGSNYSIAE